MLPFLPTWPLVGAINFGYAIAGTSWLLYWAYVAACYPVIAVTTLYQFETVARFARRQLRKLLSELQFTKDVIALFDLPALEIDVDVEGLMCIRGVTLSISTLTIIAYGIEVGIKLSDDMEVAIVAERVTIKLFRRIDVGDVYANVKGGQYEMTFGQLAKKTKDEDGQSLMVSKTPLLVAAAKEGDTSSMPVTNMKDEMSNGHAPKAVPVGQALKSAKRIFANDQEAATEYVRILRWIEETSIVTAVVQEAQGKVEQRGGDIDDLLENDKDMRAAICSCLHSKPTIPHPAKRSIRVSTIKSLDKYGIRKFLHRLPMLLRLQLSIISYFHPIFIESITAGASGAWIQSILSEVVFKNRPEDDIAVKNLRKRISTWLSDANFVVQTTGISGVGYVPLNPQYDILSTLIFDDLMAYRTLPEEVKLSRVVRLGGADARITVPCFLLPHHEHLLPPKPTAADEARQREKVEAADGGPKTVQAEYELEQTLKDEATFGVAAHLRLPAFFDQSLLDFIAAIVKATKIVEIKKDDQQSFEEARGFKELTRAVKNEVKNGMHRVAIDAAANDKWISKLVGKVTRKLQKVQGDVGYNGDLPVPLKVYRDQAESASKLLA